MMSESSSTLDSPLVFVDIETNGLDPIHGRVVEVAAIRVEDSKVVQSFRTLLDPETPLPYFITKLTGITSNDLLGAPTFDQIAEELTAVLNGAIFVAHNVRFDYSFLKQEFGRLGLDFRPKQLCTVKLSRALYPGERGHKLEDIIRRHDFSFASRHRAYDDAAVLWQFIQHVRNNFPAEQVNAAIAKQLRSPAIPKNIEPDLVRFLPETTGVYIFEDASGIPLYVGKSINIKKRVLSHFGLDHAEPKEFKIAQTIAHITTHETTGELAALLLESKLVKELRPLHNRQLRPTPKMVVARQRPTTQGYLGVHLEEVTQIDPADSKHVLAVYPHRNKAKKSLEDITVLNELCPKLMGLDKSVGACFRHQLRKCRGACVGQEPADVYNERVLLSFERLRIQAWPFTGPILLQEKSYGKNQRAIIVDNWCIRGEVTYEEYCEPVLQSLPEVFDLDTYKILQTFLTTKAGKLQIRVLTPEQLQVLV